MDDSTCFLRWRELRTILRQIDVALEHKNISNHTLAAYVTCVVPGLCYVSFGSVGHHESVEPNQELLVASLLLVAMPGAPGSFLVLAVRPGAPSSFLFVLKESEGHPGGGLRTGRTASILKLTSVATAKPQK